MPSSRKRLGLGVVALAVASSGVSVLAAAPAQANPAGTGLVINEVYGGGGATSGSPTYKQDFVELYNPTSAAISLSGLGLQYRSATYTGATPTVAALSGSVGAGKTFLIQVSAGTVGGDIPTPDLTTTTALTMSATAGQVLLLPSTTGVTTVGDLAGNANVIDAVGFGSTPTSFEGAKTGTDLNNTSSIQRKAQSPAGDTDNNASDFAVPGTPSPTPSGGGTTTPGTLAATNPGAKTATTGSPIASFTLAASGGTSPYTWTATGLPAGVTVSSAGVVSGTPTAAGTYNVTATVTDAASATAQTAFTITVSDAGAVTPIAQIQGTNTATSPLAGQNVTTQGVVTATYPAGGFNGYYIQTGGTGGATDATPGASDAVFVFAPSLGAANFPAVGASVQVTGAVSEFSGTTEITSNAVSPVTPALAAVTPLAAAYPTTEDAREAHEGELLAPTNTFTVTNTFSTNQYAEIGLATGTKPLMVPTEVADAQDAAAIAAVNADNAARGVTLDDGASINFLTSGNGGNKNIPLPWLTATKTVSVGAQATFKAPVVLEYRNSTWKFQPQTEVTGDGSNVATFSDFRAANAAPQSVGGNIKLATFNVLNYFTTTAASVGCTSVYTDREGNPITANTCPDPGPRGAANDANLKRQQDKIVAAINKLGADVVSLEEIENSVKFGKDRDDALSKLVAALNAATGATTWAYVPSPDASTLPATSAQDVIRTAFIYKPAAIVPVGTSKVLVNSAFTNARQPLAQAFKRTGALDSAAFAVVVNHFKSKGSGPDDGTGQGLSNQSRIDQANALVTFVNNTVAPSVASGKVFLTGDFNAYSKEDPIQVLETAGFTDLRTKFDAAESTYSFGGQSGSLDHVFANAAALGDVTGADVWNINSGESIAYEYSRYNYNITNFYTADQYRASDHDPEIIGLNETGAPTGPVDVNLLNINDFHGRIDANTTRFATTIEQLKAAAGESSTLFLSAGDNIGASLFASSVQKDQPTIDVLNALGLKASAVGNHEFDQGFSDLTGRVQTAAQWPYLGANVYTKGTTTPALPEYRTFTVNGITVGVIGVVTQETPSLVSPAGVANVDFGDPVAAVNRVSAQLSDGNTANGEADVIVAEYHEGAGAALPDTATCNQEINADTVFGKIARTTSANVDVIFTGHTHKQYACDGPIPGVTGKTRPILQTGEYGNNIGQVQLKVDPTTKAVASYTQRNVARSTTEDLSYPRVQQVKTIVDAALANAATVGNQPVAKISKDVTTAFSGGSYGTTGYTGGSRDDRSSESTLGDLVAQALKDGVSSFATPDLGITNPGGLRDELLYAGNTASNPANTDGVVTYAEANAVLPFNNTVAVVKLTGAQLKAVLEQQWQTNADGTVPSRPYLQLALSENVQVTANPANAAGSRITSVRISGVPLDLTKTYTVSTLSFLAAGGDNFRAFTQGTYTDTGLLDAQLWRDYLAGQTASKGAVSPDFARQQVFSTDLPASIVAGQATSFTLGMPATTAVQPLNRKSLDLTSLGSPKNTTVTATLVNGTTSTPLGSFPVTDGLAPITVTVPTTAPSTSVVTFTAAPSGTTVTVPVTAVTPPTTTPPPPPTTTPPAPVVTVGDVARGSNGTAVLTVNASTAGTYVLSGSKIKTQKVSASAAGATKLKVKLTKKQKAKLNRRGKVKVTVTITFTSVTGQVTTTTKKVVIKKKHHKNRKHR